MHHSLKVLPVLEDCKAVHCRMIIISKNLNDYICAPYEQLDGAGAGGAKRRYPKRFGEEAGKFDETR